MRIVKNAQHFDIDEIPGRTTAFTGDICLRRHFSSFGRASAKALGGRGMWAAADDTIHRAVTQRHRQHDECAWNDRRTGGRGVEISWFRDVRPIGETSVAPKESPSSDSGSLDSTFLSVDPRSDVEWTTFELDAMCLALG